MPTPSTSTTGLELIKGSLRCIGVLPSGEEPSGDEAQDALVIANQMLDSFNADGLTIFTTQINDFPLTAAKQTYTLGDGGDFNIPRPANPDLNASIVLLYNPLQPIEYQIPVLTTQDWQSKVPVKNVPGNLPILVYDDGAFPLRNLTFWPIATDNILFRLYSWQQLLQFVTLAQSNAYPPGYLEALRYNLAIRLAPEFGVSTPAEVVQLAMQSMARVKGNNADDTKLRSDITGGGSTGAQMRAELFGIPTL